MERFRQGINPREGERNVNDETAAINPTNRHPWATYNSFRANQRTRRDLLSYLLHLIIMAAAASRSLWTNFKVSREEYVMHGILMLLSLLGIVLQIATPRLYGFTRPVLVTVIRLGTAKSSVLTRSAMDMVAWTPKAPKLETLCALISLLISDHILLLSFLAIGLPLAPIPSLLLQAASLWLFGGNNLRVCEVGPMATGSVRRNLHTINDGIEGLMTLAFPNLFGGRSRSKFLSDQAVCMIITGTMQTTMGLLLPLWHLFCAESCAATSWWRSSSLPLNDLRYRLYNWWNTVMCRHSETAQYVTTVILSIWVWLTLFLYVSGDVSQQNGVV